MISLSSNRSAVILFLVLIIIIAVSGAVLLLSRPESVLITINPPQPTATPAPTITPAPILVYVTGAVAKPDQLVRLQYGSRVSDALAAAGGMTERANQTLVNLAAIVRDGDQVHVPFAEIEAESAELPTPSGGRRVYLNTATQAELETLPGIGAAMAQRIIEYRELVGEFRTLEDLDKVSGIGAATLEGLKDLVAFG